MALASPRVTSVSAHGKHSQPVRGFRPQFEWFTACTIRAVHPAHISASGEIEALQPGGDMREVRTERSTRTPWRIAGVALAAALAASGTQHVAAQANGR
ncbi:MAG TPA: hypothetical protein VGJ78_21875 [Vicinamibacterales bacterium]|jgi:hypothetical protein